MSVLKKHKNKIIAGAFALLLIGSFLTVTQTPDRKKEKMNLEKHHIADIKDPDGLQKADINKDGKMDLIVGGGETGKVFWFQSMENGWKKHTIANKYEEVEGVNVADFNNTGKISLLILDQGDDLVEIATPHENKWKTTTLDSKANAVQNSTVLDFDGDGDKDFIYSCENAGLFLLEYLGGKPEISTNWQKHFIDNLIGAWWILDNPINFDCDGKKNDIIVTARANDEFTEKPNPGLYRYEIGEWDRKKIANGSFLTVSNGDFDGDGNTNDLVTGNSARGNAIVFTNKEGTLEKETLKHGGIVVRTVGTIECNRIDLIVTHGDRLLDHLGSGLISILRKCPNVNDNSILLSKIEHIFESFKATFGLNDSVKIWKKKNDKFVTIAEFGNLIKGGMRVIGLDIDKDQANEYIIQASISGEMIWFDMSRGK